MTQNNKLLPPRPREIANRCELIRSRWTRDESRARRFRAALKQRELALRLLCRELDCRHAV